MENIILTDPEVYPEEAVISEALKGDYEKYEKFTNALYEKNLIMEWTYYNDGKNWLCKVVNKKKTTCWLSIWDIGFRVTFYFTEKNIGGIQELDISDEIKGMTGKIKNVGRLLPMVFTIDSDERLTDVLKIVDYKVSLK